MATLESYGKSRIRILLDNNPLLSTHIFIFKIISCFQADNAMEAITCIWKGMVHAEKTEPIP